MKPVYIYCLIDPMDNKPFYVGSTENIKQRINGHLFSISECHQSKWSKKTKKISDIIESGHNLTYSILHIADNFTRDHYEYIFYSILKSQGFNLLQKPVFCTSKVIKGKKTNKWQRFVNRNQFLVNYLDIKNNNLYLEYNSKI